MGELLEKLGLLVILEVSVVLGQVNREACISSYSTDLRKIMLDISGLVQTIHSDLRACPGAARELSRECQ
jgi:hypothetical protein